jgi:monofunctional biosynthetic peptidoglycan transglycosylase
MFAYHPGFDFAAIYAAIAERERGGRVRGASTISQQVAKNLFLWPGQSYVRKGLEAYLTLLIERLWPKRRILEVYLNVAEFGDGIYGVGAAAARFFRTDPLHLTRTEAARLAAVLPAPRHLHVERPSAYVLRREAWIVGQMGQLGGAGYLEELGAGR